MNTSFISEHSAEFSLVPALKKILEGKFSCVVPLYPWANRETSKISKFVHKNDEFLIIAMFCRRPKISARVEKQICITMNYELEEIKKLGEKKGIPVIAGCPIATNFWELAKTKKCIFLSIGHQLTRDYIVPIMNLMNIKDTPILTTEKIFELINNVCKNQNVSSFEEFLTYVRIISPHPIFGSRYKPVYFLLKNK